MVIMIHCFLFTEDLISDTSSYKSCPGMFKSSSMEMIATGDEDYQDSAMTGAIGDDKGMELPHKSYDVKLYSILLIGVYFLNLCFQPTTEAGTSMNRRIEQYRQLQSLGMSQETSLPGTPTLTTTHTCKTTILFLVLHGGGLQTLNGGSLSSSPSWQGSLSSSGSMHGNSSHSL